MMALVELVTGMQTAPETLAMARSFVERLGKTGKIRWPEWLFAICRCGNHTQENLLLYPTLSPCHVREIRIQRASTPK